MPRRRLPLLVALAAALACRGGEERIEIAPGLRLERPAPAARTAFAFAAAPGTFLDLEVEQQGADVAVALLAPGGEPLTVVDSPSGASGSERLRAVTRAGGEHRLELRRLDDGGGGRVTVTVREARPATAEDRLRAEALAAFHRGDTIHFAADGSPLAEAPAHYRRAIALRRRLAAGDPEPSLLHQRLGEVLWALGRVADAQEAFEDALAALPAGGDAAARALLLNQLGRGWRALGEPVRAEACYRRAIAVARAAGDGAGEATALGNLAVVEETAGDTEAALVHHRESLARWRGLGRPREEATQIANLAALYTRIGRTEDAADLLAEALALSAGAAPRARADLLVDLGWNELIAGRPERALEALDEALVLARAADDSRLEAGALDRRASALHALGRHAEERRGYREALEIVRRADDHAAEGHVLLSLGQLALDDGDFAAAGARFERALELLAANGDRHGAVAARVALAAAARDAGDLAAAQRGLERAVAELDALRAQVPGALSRSVFLAARYDAYEALVAVLMERHREHPAQGLDRRALAVAERAKARGFAEALARDGGGGSAGDGASGLFEHARRLEHRRLGLLGDPARRGEAEALEREVRRLLLAADRDAGLDGRAAGPVRTLDAAEIQSLLDADTALLAYALGEERSHLWRVEREAIAAFDLPPRRTVETLARRVSALLAEGDAPFAAAQAELTVGALAHALLPAGVLDGLDGRRLAIVPADALHLVPFALLPGPSGRPLLFDHEIVQLPSATALALQRRRLAGRAPAERELAVVADPVYTADDERLAAAATAGPSPAAQPSSDLQRAAEDLGLDLERLAGTGREAEAILAFVPAAERFAATGLAARRELVVSGRLAGFRTLHFATHGLLHPTRPELSGLVLSLFDRGGRRRDGFLRAQEIAALSLPAELVVLSACRTGLGRPIRGEGLVGLPQAFFLAGARTLVVSLRPVSDRETVALMVRFHELRLGEGLSPAAALRRAQIERASRPGAPPAAWAGFIVMGDWR